MSLSSPYWRQMSFSAASKAWKTVSPAAREVVMDSSMSRNWTLS